jgi:hypothetical protein
VIAVTTRGGPSHGAGSFNEISGTIVAALLRQLGWTHFTLLLPIKESLRREFSAQMCRIERWNTRTLQKKIQSMLFEHNALSRQPEELAQIEIKALRERDKLTPDLVK